MDAMKELVKAIKEALQAQKGTEPFDTLATVKRVENGVAWVHMPGGVDETPVELTIDAKPGDTVRARVAKGRAWLTGNTTAPPTDDTEAKKAKRMAIGASAGVKALKKNVKDVSEDVDNIEDRLDGGEFTLEGETTWYCLSTSMSTFAKDGDWSTSIPTLTTGKYVWSKIVFTTADGESTESAPFYNASVQLTLEADKAADDAATAAAEAKTIAEGVESHFWHDSNGAHVSTVDKSTASGSSITAAGTGIIQRVDGKVVSSWTNSALNFYDCTRADPNSADIVASYSRSGITQYVNNKQVMALTASGLSLYNPSDGSTLLAAYSGMSADFYSSGNKVAEFGASPVIGRTDSTNKNIKMDPSDGLAFRVGTTTYATVLPTVYQQQKKLSITCSDSNSEYAKLELFSSGGGWRLEHSHNNITTSLYCLGGEIYTSRPLNVSGALYVGGSEVQAMTASNIKSALGISTYGIIYSKSESSQPQSLSNGSGAEFPITFSPKSGYKLFAIQSVETNHNNMCSIGKFVVEGSSVKVTVTNRGGSTQSVTVTAKALFIKSELFTEQ